MNNLIQYATALKAFGCSLDLNSSISDVAVTGYPDRDTAKQILDSALEDISKYSYTANDADGIAVFVLVDTIDNNANPISEQIKENILTSLGLKQQGRFVAQELALVKVNRSWHTSDIPNTCSKFGDICTNRGVTDVEGKRGRKSTRQPEEYHKENSRGISREQLVTPAVQTLYDNIPKDNLISIKSGVSSFTLKDISDLRKEDLELLLDKVNQALGR